MCHIHQVYGTHIRPLTYRPERIIFGISIPILISHTVQTNVVVIKVKVTAIIVSIYGRSRGQTATLQSRQTFIIYILRTDM